MSDTLETDLLYLKQRPSLVQMTTHFNQFVKKCQQLERERDEAIRQRNETNESSKYAVDYAIRERDEARDQSQRLRVQLNHYTQANEMAEQAFRERDESHKIAERAIDDLAWFNETNSQRLRTELKKLKEASK